MIKPRVKYMKYLTLVVCFYLASCATITVNVYFPAEEVRDAYSSLEEEFLEEGGNGDTEAKEPAEKGVAEPTPAPQSNRYPEKPTLTSEKRVIVLNRGISLDFGNYAWAQGNISSQITKKIRGMPEVIDAYKQRAKRKNIINEMLKESMVKEGTQGLLVKEGKLTAEQEKAFKAENADREIIIRGMARAIVEINNLDPTPENIDKVLPEAARQFASVRRREAK